MAEGIAGPRPALVPGDGNADGGPKLGVFLAILDFPLLVAGYRSVIDAAPDLQVVGALECRERLREQVAESAADLVITECLPSLGTGCASLETIAEIRAARPTARILGLDLRCGGEFSLAIRAGAAGVLTREAAPGEVLAALRGVSHGETYVSPSLVTRMVNTYVLQSAPEAPDDAFETLSDRAREVFRLAAIGNSNREIARKLNLPEQTIHNQRALVMEKLGFHDRVELMRYALRRGLIQVTEL